MFGWMCVFPKLFFAVNTKYEMEVDTMRGGMLQVSACLPPSLSPSLPPSFSRSPRALSLAIPRARARALSLSLSDTRTHTEKIF